MERRQGDRSEDMQSRRQSNTNLARLQLLLSDASSKSNLEGLESACSSLLLECASSSSPVTWTSLWRCYKATKSLSGMISCEAYEALWRAALKASYVTNAVEIFRAMMTQIADQPDVPSPSSPKLLHSDRRCIVKHQRKYSSIISQLLKVKGRGLASRQLAYQLWKELYTTAQASKRFAIDLGGLDAASCRIGLNACVESGKIQEARDLIAQMRATQIKPGHGAYNILIKFYCNRGDMEAAIKVLKEMQSLGLPPDLYTYNTLISGYSKIGDVEKAKAILDNALMTECQPDIRTYSAYLNALAKRGDSRGARDTIESLWLLSEEQTGSLTYPKPNAWSYAGLIEAYLRGGDLAGAESAYAEMKTRGGGIYRSSVVGNLLIQAYLRLGPSGQERAWRVLTDMIAEGVEVGADSYCLFMDSLATSGEEDSAQEVMRLLSKIRAAGIAPDAVQLSTLSKALVRLGRSSEALDVSAEIDACDNAGGADLFAMNQQVFLFTQWGRMDRAEAAAERAALFASSTSLPPPVEAYGALIRGYYKRKELRPLVAAFRKFLSLGGIPNRPMANAVVRLCLLKGDNTTALQAIRAMKLLGVDMDPDRYRAWVMQVQKRTEAWSRRSAEARARGAETQRLFEGHDALDPSLQGNDYLNDTEQNKSRSLRTFNDRIIRESQVGFERLKWFLGLPNAYYRSEWDRE